MGQWLSTVGETASPRRRRSVTIVDSSEQTWITAAAEGQQPIGDAYVRRGTTGKETRSPCGGVSVFTEVNQSIPLRADQSISYFGPVQTWAIAYWAVHT